MSYLVKFWLLIAMGTNLVSCENPRVIDCSEVARSEYRKGVCEGIGRVVRPADGTAEHLILADGSYAVVELSLFPEIKDGDVVRIRAEYFRGDRYVDLTQDEFIEVIE